MRCDLNPFLKEDISFLNLIFILLHGQSIERSVALNSLHKQLKASGFAGGV